MRKGFLSPIIIGIVFLNFAILVIFFLIFSGRFKLGVGITSSPSPVTSIQPIAAETPEPKKVVVVPTPSPQLCPDCEVLTLYPKDDAYIESTAPESNYGSAPTLRVDGEPQENFLLKFEVSGVGTRKINNVKLRLYNTNQSKFGGVIHKISDNSWNEGTVTWKNAPKADTSTVGSLGAVVADNWFEVDVTPAISGDGTASLLIDSNYQDGAFYTSKEGASGFAPQLVVTIL